MPLFEYLLKVNLTLILWWSVYAIIFNRFTFFRWNRWFLLASVVLSFALPLFRLPETAVIQDFSEFHGINWETVESLIIEPAISTAGGTLPRVAGWLAPVYIAGGFVLFLTFLLRYHAVGKRVSGARLVRDGKIRIYVLDIPAGSFTLFRKVFLDRFSWENHPGPVIRHEMTHARQGHSYDLLLFAFACICLWFNPFVYLLFRYARENHEYLADEHARSSKGRLIQYLSCMQRETIRSFSPGVVNYFKSSTIKKRIIMLSRIYTNKRKKWYYLGIIPLVILLLMAFQPVNETPVFADLRISVSGEVPSLFPLPGEFREKITWGHNHEATDPISQKTRIHKGVDIAAPEGTMVRSSAGGKVLVAEFAEGWGNLVVIGHDQGYETRYAHLKAIHVTEGDQVGAGMQIGEVGSTGRSTGPHLHYEVRKDGAYLDPSEYY
jgi:murein DD-endopeptidase MepM/ murein hydrolase activator NlpD